MSDEEQGQYTTYTHTLDDFLASARAGGFTVSDEFAKPLIAELERLITTVDEIGSSQLLATAPKMSDSHTAQWISAKMHASAVGELGMLPGLRRAATTMLPKLIEALEITRRRYRETEDQIAGTIRQIGGDR